MTHLPEERREEGMGYSILLGWGRRRTERSSKALGTAPVAL